MLMDGKLFIKFAKMLKLKKNVATYMRHYVFTYYESIDVSPDEREFFIQFKIYCEKFTSAHQLLD